MGRKSDNAYTPDDIDFYYHDRIDDVWQGVHACIRLDDGTEAACESVCQQVQTDVSSIDDDMIYDSLDALDACDCNPCDICKDSGAFE